MPGASGPGAVYTWEGRKSGAGRMEIREVVRTLKPKPGFLRLFMGIRREERTPIVEIMQQTPPIPVAAFSMRKAPPG